MEIISLALAILLNCTPLAAESERSRNISGKIVEHTTGEALTGARIEVIGTEISVLSDFDGEFEITVDESSELSLRVSYISYQKKIIRNYKFNEELLIELKNKSDKIATNNQSHTQST